MSMLETIQSGLDLGKQHKTPLPITRELMQGVTVKDPFEFAAVAVWVLIFLPLDIFIFTPWVTLSHLDMALKGETPPK